MSPGHWRKYPRTLHHPSSPGVGSDDKVARDLSALQGREVVVTEKMDGENTSLYADGFHARSLEQAFHPSRSWLAGFHGQIGWQIPQGHRICGENLFARHSVGYDALPSYFLAFSVWDGDRCLDWDAGCAICADLGVAMVPVLWRGPYSDAKVAEITGQLDTTRSEGIVIRDAASFAADAFSTHVIKWVRKGHVQSDTHWRNAPLEQNGLEGAA